MSGHITLILGGARSGKSTYAERLAMESGRPVLYLATASPGDEEMAARIARHQAQRPAPWRTIEAPINLLDAFRAGASPGDVVLLDCLTLWVSNVLLREIGPVDEIDTIAPTTWATLETLLIEEALALLTDSRARDVRLLLVSNEVGLGVVPAFPLGRHFQDILGRVNQAVAATAETVILMVAGLPVDLRQLTSPRPIPPLPARRERG
jgi:adenosylcobinamide kinase/adenosylcobinamide-phosphate guanylyltransferase